MHGGFENFLAEMIITTRRCIACKNHVARSKIKVTVGTLSLCISKLCPTHKFIPKIGGVENYLSEMIITTSQISRSQSTLTVCAKASHVHPIISSGMVGFENYSAQMIIKTRQCVLCKNHVATSKVKFIVRTYSLCIGLNEIYLCPAHNFVFWPASGMV